MRGFALSFGVFAVMPTFAFVVTGVIAYTSERGMRDPSGTFTVLVICYVAMLAIGAGIAHPRGFTREFFAESLRLFAESLRHGARMLGVGAVNAPGQQNMPVQQLVQQPGV